ncbi:UNVERIFIED_CONTAM: hypothetical protein Slati_3416300 [Sesamum latifolium]|uniref:Uncharacterized protein n=1 Tax=Sesamum latifolium TaxID=2727402 RepID=A0AAW2UFX3_9LAMI
MLPLAFRRITRTRVISNHDHTCLRNIARRDLKEPIVFSGSIDAHDHNRGVGQWGSRPFDPRRGGCSISSRSRVLKGLKSIDYLSVHHSIVCKRG